MFLKEMQDLNLYANILRDKGCRVVVELENPADFTLNIVLKSAPKVHFKIPGKLTRHDVFRAYLQALRVIESKEK